MHIAASGVGRLAPRPAAAGALLGATGSYTPAITIISAGFAAAAGVLLLGRAPGPAAASHSTGQDRT